MQACASRRRKMIPMANDGCVYVVDDDEAVRDALSGLLEAGGYLCRTFSSAQEFLKAAPTLRPGCLIVDVRMPGMDGLELQQLLVERALHFPLIVVTGHGDVPLAVRAMKAGAVDFIQKPFNAKAMLESTKNAMRRVAEPQQADAMAAQARACLHSLSRREREVLQGLLTGLPNRRSRMSWGSARARLKSTAPGLWKRCAPAAFRNWSGWDLPLGYSRVSTQIRASMI